MSVSLAPRVTARRSADELKALAEQGNVELRSLAADEASPAEVVAWVAPALLGAGRSAVADLGITTVADLIRLDVDDVAVVGGDIRVTGRPIHRPSPPPHPLGAS